MWVCRSAGLRDCVVSDLVADFRAEAEAFCLLLESEPTDSVSARRGELLARLCSLCSAAARLPREDGILRAVEVDPVSAPSLEDLRPVDRYWMVFDPYEPEPPIVGSIIDDIQEIYIELQNVLVGREIDERLQRGAAAQWRFAFDVHWGRHAWSAMAALHASLQSVP